MRERLSAMNADAAIEMWVGTFHAFGLELVTKWPSSVGRTAQGPHSRPDRFARHCSKTNLEKLPLRHFQNLYEPAYELVPVLARDFPLQGRACPARRISRRAADAAARRGRKREERETPRSSQEIAEIYRIYERTCWPQRRRRFRGSGRARGAAVRKIRTSRHTWPASSISLSMNFRM